jgi:hypothetical protein
MGIIRKATGISTWAPSGTGPPTRKERATPREVTSFRSVKGRVATTVQRLPG